MIVSPEDLRSIILNAHKIKKDHICNKCQGTGYENWNGETGDDVKPGRLVSYTNDRIDGECENCEGIGYVDIFIYVDDNW